MTTRKTTRFLHMLLWMMLLFSKQLDWTRLLFSPTRGDNDLDPEVRAQLVQGNVQAYLSFGEEKGEGKGKGKGKFPVRPSCFAIGGSSTTTERTERKNEYRACGRKGLWTNDRECAMSPSSLSSTTQTRTVRMTAQLHPSSQAKEGHNVFPFSMISAMTLKHSRTWPVENEPLPTESTGQTPTASTTVDTGTGGIFHVRAMDDNDEPWLIETDNKSGWNTRFKSGTYRGMLYGVVLRDYPKQVVSLIEAESVPANMREFLS